MTRRLVLLAAACASIAPFLAQVSGEEPARYALVDGWSPVPVPGTAEWEMSGAAVSPDGSRLFMSHRADPPILDIDPPSARIVRSWGTAMIAWPHGLYLDRDGSLWVSDAMHFNAPTGVAVARNGDVFISDGHGGTTNARVVVFEKRGRFLRTWGTRGTGPGEFGEPHAIALDTRERVSVADRTNGRLQVFDKAGRFLAQWTGFGQRPCGIAIGADDTIYVTSHDAQAHENIITIARASDGQVVEVSTNALDGIDGIAVDGKGTLYATSATGHAVAKYVRTYAAPCQLL